MKRRDFSGERVDRYLLVSLLGVGAAGSVYEAIDTTLEDSPTFAIKCVLKSSNVQRRQQQFAEVKNHHAIAGSPHVLSLCDVFAEGCYFFLVLPFREMDLYKAIWQEQLYWRNDALIKKVFLEILDGVYACHKKGVYHRDLKPENIMCNADGTKAQLCDFGLSTNHRVCRDGGCGTLSYMSPECLDGAEIFYYANRTDIWALGIILFNMVTGHCPWDEARLTNKAYTSFCSRKDYLLRTSPISAPLSELLYKMWHWNPVKRMPIPAIRQAIAGMETFYMVPRSAHIPSPLSRQLILADSQQSKTRVAPVVEEKKKGHRAFIDVLEHLLLAWRLNQSREVAGTYLDFS